MWSVPEWEGCSVSVCFFVYNLWTLDEPPESESSHLISFSPTTINLKMDAKTHVAHRVK